MNLSKTQNENIKLTKKLNEPHKGEKIIPIADDLIVDLENVEKIFINENIEYKVLKNINLKIKKGEFIVILGPSGSGKTTLMNIISGLERATNGVVNILGNNLINFDNTELTTFRRENIGYIFQQYGLLPNLTVKDNILLGEYLQKKNNSYFAKIYYKEVKELNKEYKNKISNEFLKEEKSIIKNIDVKKNLFKKISEINNEEYKHALFNLFEKHTNLFYGNNHEIGDYVDIEEKHEFIEYISKRKNLLDKYFYNINSVVGVRDDYFLVDNVMSMLEIDKIAKKYPGQLSGGQQQRVSIARTLIKKPKILFADEPTGAVDTKMSKIIMNSLSDINKMLGTTVVIVTHNPAIAQMADRVIHFFDGSISQIAVNNNKKTVDEIK